MKLDLRRLVFDEVRKRASKNPTVDLHTLSLVLDKTPSKLRDALRELEKMGFVCSSLAPRRQGILCIAREVQYALTPRGAAIPDEEIPFTKPAVASPKGHDEVVAVLSTTPRSVADLSELSGTSVTSTRRTLAALLETGAVTRIRDWDSQSWHYAIPSEGSATAPKP